MDILVKQKMVMILVIVVLGFTAAHFMQQRLDLIENSKIHDTQNQDSIYNQKLSENTIEYNILMNSEERVYINDKNKVITKDSNATLFFAINNEYPLNTRFWVNNVACNDGNTVFFNPKYETFDRLTVDKNETRIFPLRVYYPKNILIESTRSFNCNIHISNGLTEYDIESFLLVLRNE